MTRHAFHEEGSTLLTAGALDVVLDVELKRAKRAQDYLTLVVIDLRREWEGISVTADDGTLRTVAQIIGKEVRDGDCVAHTGAGALTLALLDADFRHARDVVDRIVARFDAYKFTTALHATIGAACCPTDAVDAATLAQIASARPLVTWNSRHPGGEKGRHL